MANVVAQEASFPPPLPTLCLPRVSTNLFCGINAYGGASMKQDHFLMTSEPIAWVRRLTNATQVRFRQRKAANVGTLDRLAK